MITGARLHPATFPWQYNFASIEHKQPNLFSDLPRWLIRADVVRPYDFNELGGNLKFLKPRAGSCSKNLNPVVRRDKPPPACGHLP
jgi:hypothetical protein